MRGTHQVYICVSLWRFQRQPAQPYLRRNGLRAAQDSLTLLHVLLELQRRSPVKFTVAAATVNPETPEFSPEPLIEPWQCKDADMT